MLRSRSGGAAVLTLVAGLVLATAAPANAVVVDAPISDWADPARFRMQPVGSYDSPSSGASAAEIVAFYAPAKRMFVINAADVAVEVLDVADPANPTQLFLIDAAALGGAANSVAIRPDGLGAIAVQNDDKAAPGRVVFFDAAGDGTLLGSVEVGALPDMLTFSPDGTRVLTANEGEPAEDYSADPQGSIGVIDVPSTVEAPQQSAVRIAGFGAFEAQRAELEAAGLRVFGYRGGPNPNGTAADGNLTVPGSTTTPLADSLEPEYITLSADSATAYATLQEANAVAVIDVATATVTAINPLGFKDWRTSALDPSDRDGAINIRPWPVFGMYQPDSIANVSAGGQTYLITANEGDARAWPSGGGVVPDVPSAGLYNEEARVKDLGDPDTGLPALCESFGAGFVGTPGYPATAAGFLADDALGRLNITLTRGYDATNDCYSSLYAYGARSFSVWTADGTQVFDSGDSLEQLTARLMPANFNASNSKNNLEDRSDDKGPEPEGVVIGDINATAYAFIGLERIGGVAVYSLTDPTNPAYVGYLNNRDFSQDTGVAAAGDNGPEGLAFIPAAASPTGLPMLAVGSEVSGTTTMFDIVVPDPAPGAAPALANTGGTASIAVWAAGGLLTLAGLVLLVLRRRARANG